MSLHCFLTSLVFDEKLSVNCIEDGVHGVLVLVHGEFYLFYFFHDFLCL